MSLDMKTIAIIGAGISGLACARVLVASGHTVQVFDKGRGPGGRMSTRRVPTDLGEVSFDHGAQYFTARDPAFVAQIEQLKARGAVGVWTGELVRLHRDGKTAPLANESLYVGTPTMNSVIRALGDNIGIAWSTRVETITRQGDHWQLLADDGTDLGIFDTLVCAVPGEQVAPLLKDIAPDFAALGETITSLPCWAGLFAFDAPLSLPFDALRLEGHDSVDFIAMNNSKPRRSDICAYVVHARPDWTAQHIEDTPAHIAKHLLQALLGFADNRPRVIHASAHRWRYARVEVENGLGSIYDADTRLGMCGDWLSGPRVESAWLSGHHLGLKMTDAEGEFNPALQTAGE